MLSAIDYQIWFKVLTFLLIASQLACMSVVATGFVFRREMLVKKTYMQIIMMMCASDILSSFFTYVYIPEYEGPWCTSQSFLWMFFRRAEWLWATMIPVCLYSSLRSIPIRFGVCNVIVWTTNTLIAILPLCFGVQYGGGANGRYFCFFEDTQAGLQWYAYTMIVVGTICSFLGMLILLLLEYERRTRFSSADDFGKAISGLVSKNIGYPVCLFVCWGPFSIAFLAIDVVDKDVRTNTQNWTLLITFALSSLFGFMVGAVFFLKSTEARQRWAQLIYCRKTNPSSADHPAEGGDPRGSLTAGTNITPDFVDDDEWEERTSMTSITSRDTGHSAASSHNPMRYSDKSEGSDNRIVSGDIAISNLRLHRHEADDDIPPTDAA